MLAPQRGLTGAGTTDKMTLKYIKEHRDHSANDQPKLFG